MSEAIPSPFMATHAMPMGLEGNFTLNELPFYVYPDWNPECIYWTVYTYKLSFIGKAPEKSIIQGASVS
jgi:hypothetical protein